MPGTILMMLTFPLCSHYDSRSEICFFINPITPVSSADWRQKLLKKNSLYSRLALDSATHATNSCLFCVCPVCMRFIFIFIFLGSHSYLSSDSKYCIPGPPEYQSDAL